MKSNNQINVVIADDEKSIRDGLKKSVKWEQLNTSVIDVLSDGKQTLESIIENKPDICIIDICMPELTGLEVIKMCKQQEIETEFLILSGYNDFSYAQEAIRCGAKGYLLKPINLEKLMSELYNLCSYIINKKSLNINLDQLRKTSKFHVLNQIINGDIRAEQIESFNLVDFKINNTTNRIIVFSFNDESQTCNIEENALSLLEQTHYSVPCELWSPRPNQVLLLFNDSSNDFRLSYDIARLSMRKLSTLSNKLIGIGIGDAVDSLQKTSYSYNRALLSLSYQMYKEQPSIHDPSIICDTAPDMSTSSIDYSKLSDAILASDYEKMNRYCDSFFYSLFYVPQPPPTFIKGMCIYLVANVLKDLNQRIQSNFSFPEISYEELNHLVTFSELTKWMLSFFDDCCKVSEEITSINTHNIDNIIEKAMQYIHNNLLNSIKAKDIASFVNLSESYFAAYFKQKTGINLRQYLLNCKIDYAKTRILEDNISISEIAYELGYTDYRSFSRAFKNVTTMSPSEYITQHSENPNQ